MEYQQIAAAAFLAAPSTDPLLRAVLERCGGGYCGLVFGTLLGPETTGPVSMAVGCGSGTCVSGFLAAPMTRLFLPSGGACVGCVVRGCCLRTT